MYEVLIRPEAEQDAEEAFLWYEDKRKGLGYDFLLQVEAGLRFIARNPLLSSSEYKGTKKYLIRRFPYKIIYSAEKNKIIVLGIIHMKRTPGIAENRLPST